MTVRTNRDIYTPLHGMIKKRSEKHLAESMFDTTCFMCDKGSAVVTTEYAIRSIKTFGRLKVKELNEKDKDGLPIILIK